MAALLRVGGERGDGAAHVARRLGDAEVGDALGRVAPVGLGDAERVEHHLRAQPARGEGDGGAAVGGEVLGLREREPDDGGLGEVVEGVDAVGDGVVLRRAVGHLDHQPAGVADQQRQREVAGDQVGLDRQVEQVQAVAEVVLPHRRVPVEELLAAPDVVDEHVEPALLAVDALDERLDLVGLEVVGRHGDAGAAGLRDQLGGLLDRLGAVVLGAGGARAAAGAVDGGAGLAERDGDAAAGAAGGAGDEGDRAFEVRVRHGAIVTGR